MAPTTMAPTTMAPTTMAPTTMAPPSLSTPATAKAAIGSLVDCALSQGATSSDIIDEITKIAIGSVSTVEGANAIKNLSDQSKVPEAGDVNKVLQAARVAMESIVPQKTVSNRIGVEAVVALAEAAVIPGAQRGADVIPVASLAIEAAKNNNNAINAIKYLSVAALDPVAADLKQVTEAVKVAIATITAPEPTAAPAAPAPAPVEAGTASGCYPVRKYDMKNVQPFMVDDTDDYQTFTSTKQ